VRVRCTQIKSFLERSRIQTTSYLGFVTIWKRANECMSMCNFCSFFDFITASSAAIANILHDAPLKECRLLAHQTNLTPEPFHIEISNVFSIQKNFTYTYQKKSRQSIDSNGEEFIIDAWDAIKPRGYFS
jgi:hypothetical protein